MNPVPEKLTSFRVYLSGEDLLGTADVELPSLEHMTETVQGAGIAGEIDSPVVGHYGSMTLKLSWRTVTGNLIQLARPQAHHLDLRGSIQQYDSGLGIYQHVPLKVVVFAVPKNTSLGKLEVGKPQENETELEVMYLKLTLAGEDRIEIDKYNFINRVDDVDYLAVIRRNLGLEG